MTLAPKTLKEGNADSVDVPLDPAARAQKRRNEWSGGLVHSEDAGAFDAAFWARSTPEQRLASVWQMAQEWWRREHPDGPALRLDRSAFGVRRRAR